MNWSGYAKSYRALLIYVDLSEVLSTCKTSKPLDLSSLFSLAVPVNTSTNKRSVTLNYVKRSCMVLFFRTIFTCVNCTPSFKLAQAQKFLGLFPITDLALRQEVFSAPRTCCPVLCKPFKPAALWQSPVFLFKKSF